MSDLIGLRMKIMFTDFFLIVILQIESYFHTHNVLLNLESLCLTQGI